MVWANGTITTYGYFGIAAVAAISSATIVIPIVPLEILVFLAAAQLNPVLIGISAGVGSAIGEMTAYFLARGGEFVLEKKYKKQIHHIEKLFQKYGGWLIIFIVGTIPVIPFDVMGLFCGSIHYDRNKFFIATAAGKTVRYTAIALAGYFGMHWILGYFV